MISHQNVKLHGMISGKKTIIQKKQKWMIADGKETELD
jgi:hypothetical protein